jgi:hypothetical protein
MADNRYYTDAEACRLSGVDWHRFIRFCREAGFGRIVDEKPGGGCTYLIPVAIVGEISAERERCIDAVLARIAEREARHE